MRVTPQTDDETVLGKSVAMDELGSSNGMFNEDMVLGSHMLTDKYEQPDDMSNEIMGSGRELPIGAPEQPAGPSDAAKPTGENAPSASSSREPVETLERADYLGQSDRETSIVARISAFADDEHARVVAAVSLRSGSVDDAADAVIDALGRAWEQLEKGKPIDNLAAWVTRAAMNQMRSRHRHLAVVGRKRHLFVSGDHPDPSSAAVDRLDVARALATLTDRQREVVVLRYGLDLGLADIADQLGIAEGTVKATLHQTRTILAEKLGTPTPGASND